MTALIVVFVLLAGALFALTRFAQSDARRVGAAALTALEEQWRPHAAEVQKIDEHAAGVEEDDDGDDPRRRSARPRALSSLSQPASGESTSTTSQRASPSPSTPTSTS